MGKTYRAERTNKAKVPHKRDKRVVIPVDNEVILDTDPPRCFYCGTDCPSGGCCEKVSGWSK